MDKRCKYDHEPDWYISPKGYRQCRVCRKIAVGKYNKQNAVRYKQYQKDNRQSNLEARRAYDRIRNQDPQRKKAHIARKYNLTVEQYDAMWENQGFKCAICKAVLTNGKTGAHVDHDHKCCPEKKSCGTCVRGILCSHCNNGIARFKEDVEIMTAAIEYLSRENPN